MGRPACLGRSLLYTFKIRDLSLKKFITELFLFVEYMLRKIKSGFSYNFLIYLDCVLLARKGMAVKMDEIIGKINKASNIAVLTHVSEDADALGSAAAFLYAMESLGKPADIYISEKPEDRLNCFGDIFTVYEDNSKLESYDLCVCLDSADLKRLGSRLEIFQNAGHTVNIDHHATNKGYAEADLIRGEISSTGEILYDLFIKMDIKITKPIARALYISIAGDTGCFKYSNVSPKTMRIAANLLECDIEHAGICRRLFDLYKPQVLKMHGYFMENIHEYFNGRLCIVTADDEIFSHFGTSEKDAGDIVNIPRKSEACEIAVSVRKIADKVKVSLRSNGIFDVSEIAAAFGGGGHKMAAGATFEGKTAEEAEKMIVRACKALMDKG